MEKMVSQRPAKASVGLISFLKVGDKPASAFESRYRRFAPVAQLEDAAGLNPVK